MMNYNKKFGDEGENLAEKFIVNNNFSIVEKNYRFGRYGEIDIIAEKDNCLVFFEVKNRSEYSFGGPLYSLNKNKINHLIRTASSFLQKNQKYYNYDQRFDLIAISCGEVEWIKDICRI